MKIALMCALGSGFLMASVAVFSADRITVLTEQYYPYNYTENEVDSGEILGFATELVIAVLEEAGLNYEIQIGPWGESDSIN